MSKPRTISDYPNRADDYESAAEKAHDQNTDIALDEGGDHEVTAEVIRDHVDSTDNPHGVTAGQVGAYTKQEADDLLDGKAAKNEIALPVPALPELMQVDTQQFDKVLVSGYYEEGDIERSAVWWWNSSREKSGHNGWSCINPDHLAEIGSPEWYDPEGDETDDSGEGVWERSVPTSLKDFGVLFDGVHDNTIAVQKAVDAGIPELFFDSGECLLGQVVINRPCRVIGNNTRLVGGDGLTYFSIRSSGVSVSEFICEGSTKTIIQVGASGSAAPALKNVRIFNNSFMMDADLPIIRLLEDIEDCVIQGNVLDNIFEGSKTEGTGNGINLQIGNRSYTGRQRRLLIEDNTFGSGLIHSFNNYSEGYYRGLDIVRSIDRSARGPRVYHCRDYRVSDCRFENQTGSIRLWTEGNFLNNLSQNSSASYAILAPSFGGLIQGNRIENTDGIGLRIQGSPASGCFITGNTFSNIQGQAAIDVVAGSNRSVNVTIKDNIIVNTQQHGIVIKDTTEGLLIEGNRISGIGREGTIDIYAGILFDIDPEISPRGNRSPVVRGNTIRGNDFVLGISDSQIRYGIYFADLGTTETSRFYCFFNDINAPVPIQSDRTSGHKYVAWNISHRGDYNISTGGNRVVSHNLDIPSNSID